MPGRGPAQTLRACLVIAGLRLRESLGRHAYLAATLMVGVAGFWVLGALSAPFIARHVFSDAGIYVSSSREGTLLPLRHAEAIARHPDVVAVNHMNVLALMCKPPTGVATLNGWGGTDPMRRLRDIQVAPADIAAWTASPHAVLVGAELAQRCGWTAGTTLEPPDLAGNPVPITIAGIFRSDEGGFGEQIVIAHYEHVDRMLAEPEQGQARIVQVYGRDPLALAELAGELEALLQHADPPVQAHVASGTDSLLGSFGNVSALLLSVLVALALCVLLVFVSIAAHLAAQRRACMAMLLALGFGRGLQLAAMVVELAVVVLVGALLGTALGSFLLELMSSRVGHMLGRLALSPRDGLWLLAGLPLLVAIAASAPGFALRRLRPIDLLRS